LAIV
jgi:hypothetical protein